MADILICGDTEHIRDEVKAALTLVESDVREVRDGYEVMTAVREALPDLVILDMQTGNMGGMATCMELRLEESADRLGHVPVLLLVDRRPDVFLARRAQAEGFLVKPLNPVRLRKAVAALLDGGTYQDSAYLPTSA